METWHCKALGDGVAASAPSRRIQEMFLPIFSANGQPSDMAVFTRYEANQVTAYFSPRAARLATFFGAKLANADVENLALYYIDSFKVAGRNGIRF